jgi:hypothetical protein
LESTRRYYSLYGNEIALNSNIPEFLEKAYSKVKEENIRIEYYLVEQTRKKFIEILREELITKNMDFILESKKDGFTHLLENDKYKDITRMFELFSFHEKHLEILKEKFKSYTTQMGTDHVNIFLIIQVTDKDKASDPSNFFNGLFQLKEKYDFIVLNGFGGNNSFQISLNEAFQYCINGFKKFNNLRKRPNKIAGIFIFIFGFKNKKI